jgi:hypothetical protein
MVFLGDVGFLSVFGDKDGNISAYIYVLCIPLPRA